MPVTNETQNLLPPATRLAKLLDSTFKLFQKGAIKPAMTKLAKGLWQIRNSVPKESWKGSLIAMARSHPLKDFLHQDPLTYRSFVKPRGYPGDAVLLDWVYGDPSIAAELKSLTEGGRKIYDETFHRLSAQATRLRKNIIASTIDDTSKRVAHPRILSIACGHLRELNCSKAYLSGHVGQFMGLDQDPRSLELITKEKNLARVEVVESNIADLLTQELKLGRFDLVYVAGLYDYLAIGSASRLTQVAFNLLRPSGRLLVTNHLTSNHEAGYMEAYMDWWLIYRDLKELEQLSNLIPPNQIASQRAWIDDVQIMGYLELDRK